MKSLVVYDSVFGNTRQIVQAVANALGAQTDVQTLRVGESKSQQLMGMGL